MGVNSIPTLAQSISQIFNPFRQRVVNIAAGFLGLAVGVLILYFQAESDHNLLLSVGPHLESLVEANERFELQRLIKTLSNNQKSNVYVLQKGEIRATTESPELLDTQFQMPSSLRLTDVHRLSSQGLITQIQFDREGGPVGVDIRGVALTPLGDILWTSILTAALLWLVGWFVGQLYSNRLEKSVKEALSPIQNLEQGIRQLKNSEPPAMSVPLKTAELESIRLATIETYQVLKQAMEASAHAKAQELAVEAHQRLIHDIQNPVIAIEGWAAMAANPEAHGAEEAREAALLVPQLLKNLVRQLNAAKMNFIFEVPVLLIADLRPCLNGAIDEVKMTSSRISKINLECVMPEEGVLASYDSSFLHRALVNLIKNAVESCRSQVKVVLTVNNPEDLKVSFHAKIQVMDDGPGIPIENLTNFMAGRLKSTKEDRPAKGLSSVHHIVRMHGGEVVYKVSEWGGACFEIEI